MRIGIFSKIGASGGSEHRVAELANAINTYTSHDVAILCEEKINDKIRSRVNKNIPIIEYLFKGNDANPKPIYDFDSILVVNSDSYSFSKPKYWNGESDHHNFKINLRDIPQLIFLYNFVISPSQNLYDLSKMTNDIRIICTSHDFSNQIEKKDKFEKIRDFPRIVLESPIDPNTITQYKSKSDKIRIGKHSKSISYKFNKEHKKYIEEVNKTHGEKIQWDFLGVPNNSKKDLEKFENVTLRKEYSIPVKDYLTEIDIFPFFISWDRSEPWSRSVAEGMMSGCPILATNKSGNKEQVKHLYNGMLCDDVHDFITYTRLLIDHSELREMLGYRSYKDSLEFTSEKIIKRFIQFIDKKD